jgi:transcriptional regulator with XRE-family HTH domain
MSSDATDLGSLLRRARTEAGLTQRRLAQFAGTSQPAIARYERGASVPSWATLCRLLEACGRHVRIVTDAATDPDDAELAEYLLDLTPLERLTTLTNWARVHGTAA